MPTVAVAMGVGWGWSRGQKAGQLNIYLFAVQSTGSLDWEKALYLDQHHISKTGPFG